MGRLSLALAALLGVSAYAPPVNDVGPHIEDAAVEKLRAMYGGALAPISTPVTRWYLADLESAQYAADCGDISRAAQLCTAMRRDGTYTGLVKTRTAGLVRLPRKFRGRADICAALEGRVGFGVRAVFDEMFPAAELELFQKDGFELGVAVGELVPVEGRDYPVFVRLEPEHLRFRPFENRWYYQSIAGLLPITPGDGRWVLHVPGGRVAPWRNGAWHAVGRAFISKEHAVMHRANWEAKLANPARVAYAPQGATEEQKQSWFRKVMAWGINTVFGLTPGYEVKLLESNGKGYESFDGTIERSEREYAIVVAGQVVTVEGGTGFSNQDVHAAIRKDIIQAEADALAYTLNTQGLPPWIVARYGEAALAEGARVEWITEKPADLTSEASTLGQVATAIQTLGAALQTYKRTLDVDALCERFGVPVSGDTNGDGTPDTVEADEGEWVDVELESVEAENDDGQEEAA